MHELASFFFVVLGLVLKRSVTVVCYPLVVMGAEC